MHCFRASGFLLIGRFWHREYSHNTVERLCIFINEPKEASHNFLTFFRPFREIVPLSIPSRFVAGEVGNHSTESGSERTHISGDRTTARSRTFACCFFCKTFTSEVYKFFSVIIFYKVFNNFLFRVKRFEVVKTHRFDSYLDYLFVVDTNGTLLFAKEIFTGFDKSRFRNEAYNFSTCNAESAICGTAAYLVKSNVKWSGFNICNIHRYLSDTIFVDIPTDCFCTF